MNLNNIVIAGEGGQGIQTIAKILSSALFEQGKEVSYLPSFGVEQRGAPSVAYISISDQPLRYSKFEKADYAVILQSRAIKSVENYISPNTNIIFDSSTIRAADLPKHSARLFGIPATKYAHEKFTQKSFNLIILGYLSSIFGLPEKEIWSEINLTLGKKFKSEEIKKLSRDAFIFGREAVPEKDQFSEALFRPSHRAIVYKNETKTAGISPARCKGCAVCITKCPVGALRFGQDLGVYSTPVPEIDLEKCILCGNCHNFCPDSAINVTRNN